MTKILKSHLYRYSTVTLVSRASVSEFLPAPRNPHALWYWQKFSKVTSTFIWHSESSLASCHFRISASAEERVENSHKSPLHLFNMLKLVWRAAVREILPVPRSPHAPRYWQKFSNAEILKRRLCRYLTSWNYFRAFANLNLLTFENVYPGHQALRNQHHLAPSRKKNAQKSARY